MCPDKAHSTDSGMRCVVILMTCTLVLPHDDVMLHDRRGFAGSQRASFGSGKIPRLDLIKLADMNLNTYIFEASCSAPNPRRR